MGNIIDELMKFDDGDLVELKTDVEMPLKKLGGKTFTFPIKALDPTVATEIQEEMFHFRTQGKKGMDIKMVLEDGKYRTIVEGCPTVFKNSEIQKKFKAKTPYELVKKLLTIGEMDHLKEEIESLSGFDTEDIEEEVKN